MAEVYCPSCDTAVDPKAYASLYKEAAESIGVSYGPDVSVSATKTVHCAACGRCITVQLSATVAFDLYRLPSAVCPVHGDEVQKTKDALAAWASFCESTKARRGVA